MGLTVVADSVKKVDMDVVEKAMKEALRRGLLLEKFLEFSRDWTVEDFHRYAVTGEMPQCPGTS